MFDMNISLRLLKKKKNLHLEAEKGKSAEKLNIYY